MMLVLRTTSVCALALVPVLLPNHSEKWFYPMWSWYSLHAPGVQHLMLMLLEKAEGEKWSTWRPLPRSSPQFHWFWKPVKVCWLWSEHRIQNSTPANFTDFQNPQVNWSKQRERGYQIDNLSHTTLSNSINIKSCIWGLWGKYSEQTATWQHINHNSF